jgi:lipopolysaccharide export system permease protein
MSEVSLHALLHPHPQNPEDRPKWVAEAHKRLTTPLTAMSYGMVALLTVLTGTFRRYGGFARPLASIGSVVGLLALELAFQNLAARQNALIPLMWVQAVVPGIVCAWLLFGPQLLGVRLRSASPAT